MRNPQTYPDSVVGKAIKSICWHILGDPGADSFGVGSCPVLGLSPGSYFFDPSVAQPPLPLQEFLPLQPLSLDWQPPLPLHEFCPLQACFSFSSCAAVDVRPAWEKLLEAEPADEAAFKRAAVPPSKPVKAAVSTREVLLIFIELLSPCLELSSCNLTRSAVR
jgi:hypothetical protein